MSKNELMKQNENTLNDNRYLKEIQNKFNKYKCKTIEIHSKITTFINSISSINLTTSDEDFILIITNNNSISYKKLKLLELTKGLLIERRERAIPPTTLKGRGFLAWIIWKLRENYNMVC